VKTAESTPCFNPNPISSANADATTAPTTASIVVLAGPKMLARSAVRKSERIAHERHSRVIRPDRATRLASAVTIQGVRAGRHASQ
jgi:hypothetical protein